MSDIDIYDMIINGYYTFTQYWDDINRVIIKIMQIIKTQNEDMTYEDILEKIKLIFISEGFPLPTITDSEILEVFEDNISENIGSSINVINNLLNSFNSMNINNDENNEESEINDTPLEPENNEEDNEESENVEDVSDVNITTLMQLFTQQLLNAQQQYGTFISNISNDNDLSVSANVSNSPAVNISQGSQLQFGLFSPIGLLNNPPELISGGLSSFLNRKVNVVVDKDVLKKFRNRQYKFLSDKIKEINKNCSICLDDYEETSKVKVLPCDHGFHPECITKWLTSENYTCPVCRKEIGTNDEHKIIDS
jgi:hypothetical protein